MHRILKLYNHINNFGKANGLELEVVKPGHIRYRMTVLDEHLATPTAIHGGVLSALMDAILGVSALSLTCERNQLVATVEFKMNYLAPAGPGEEIVGEGKIVRAGKNLIVTEGTIKSASGDKQIATGLGTFFPYHISKSKIIEHLDDTAKEILGKEYIERVKKQA